MHALRTRFKEEIVAEFIIFDAIRDNKSKGIKAKDLVTTLNKTKKRKHL